MRILAALVLSLLLLAAPARAQSGAEVPITEDARREFADGVSLLEDPGGPRYREAYEAFQRAYAASPSPKILSNLGLSAMMLERDGEAIDAYQRYLRDVKDVDPREREKIERDLESLRARSAELMLTLSPASARLIDTRTPASGAAVVNRYEASDGKLELRIHAGKHRLKVEAAGRESEDWSFELAPGQRIERAFTLNEPSAAAVPAPAPGATPSPVPGPPPDPAPAPAASGGLSVGTIVAIAVTAVLAVGAGVTGGLALASKSDYESFEGDRLDAEGVRETGEALNVTTDVLLGCTVAAAAVSVVLLVLDLTADAPGEQAGASPVVTSQGVGWRF
jgi:hypothetical protein